jgi:hypothetical protein
MMTPVERIEEAITHAEEMRTNASDPEAHWRLEGMIQGWRMVLRLLSEYDDGNLYA